MVLKSWQNIVVWHWCLLLKSQKGGHLWLIMLSSWHPNALLSGFRGDWVSVWVSEWLCEWNNVLLGSEVQYHAGSTSIELIVKLSSQKHPSLDLIVGKLKTLLHVLLDLQSLSAFEGCLWLLVYCTFSSCPFFSQRYGTLYQIKQSVVWFELVSLAFKIMFATLRPRCRTTFYI